MAKLCFGWNYASNHQSDEDGRIILIWKAPAVVNVLHQSRQSLTCEVILPLCPPFCYTMIYASNISVERSDLWIVDHREHSLAHIDTTTSPMSDFRDCLDQLGVFDLRYQGPTFSWSNHQPTMPIAKKLDRLLINDMALQSFPDAAANFLPPLTSDHCPCILSLAITLPSAGCV
uniref:Endonuclease/exonuclease/phosphatase domain-containing protein n=1 Tax=Brassica oleracea var. oleracea TaxID=109376 RepID=A0A0D3BZB3_BRAOL